MKEPEHNARWNPAGDGTGAHAPAEVLKTPDGHAVPRPLDPVVTMEVVQRYVEADRARSRRILFWTSSLFLLVVLVLLTLFLSIGIHVLNHSRRAAEVADQAAARTAVYSAEVIGISNELHSVVSRQEQIRAVVNTREAEIARRNRLLRSDLERFSRWVAENKGTDGQQVETLQARIRDLEGVLSRLESQIGPVRPAGGGATGPAPVDAGRGVADTAAGTGPDAGGGAASVADAGLAAPEPDTNVFAEALAELAAPAPPRPVTAESEISVVTFPSGDRYRGTFRDGLFHGWGVYTYANGDRYEGEFAQDMKNGWGTLQYATSDRYVGQFGNDMREGRGTLVYRNGDRYVGEFRNDMPNGKGVILYQGGGRYAGDFVNGLKHGNGMFVFANGDTYQGEFRRDERNGRGTYRYRDGSRYVGEFRNNMRHGNGRYVYPGGEEYVGEFRDGMKDGTGVCIYPNGNKVHVEWKKDALVKILDG